MLLIVPVLLGIVVALARGGSLRYLAALPIRGTGALLASFAIQVAVYLPGVRDSALTQRYGAAIYIAALALALLGLARNWHLGLAPRIALLGLALNAMVIVANGGHMPVNAAAMRSVQGQAQVRALADYQQYSNTRPADRHSRLLLFSDIFPLYAPHGHGNVFSIGDALIAAGVGTLVYGATRRPYRPQPARIRPASFVPAAHPAGIQ